jgi:hypothetical protein
MGILLLGQSPYFKTVQNVSVDETSAPYMNVMKQSYYNTTNLNTLGVTILNDLGYPEGTLANSLQWTTTMTPGAGADVWCIDWVGTIGSGSIGLNIVSAITIDTGAVGHTGTVISGGVGSAATIRGTNVYMEFTFVSMPTSINGWSANFQSGCACSSISSFRIYRKADKAALDGGALWSQLFLDAVEPLDLGRLRLMSAFIHFGSEILTNGKWDYRLTLNSRSFVDRRFHQASAHAGAISNSGNLYTSGSYTDMPVAYEDGETFQGTVAATSTLVTVASVGNSSGKVKLSVPAGTYTALSDNDIVSYEGYTASGSIKTAAGMWRVTKLVSPEIELTTNYHTGSASVFAAFSSSAGTLTVAQMNVGSRGVRPVISENILFSNPITSTGPCWFVYKKPLEAWVARSGGLYCGMPVEAAVDLCNTLNFSFWWNLTFYAGDDFATNAITYIRDNLDANLELVFEDSNECWNFSFTQYMTYAMSAAALGITASSSAFNELSWSYQGLSFARRVDIMKPVWTATRSAGQFLPVLTNWAVEIFAAGFQTYKLDGALLNAATNATLSAYTGGQSYNTGSPTFSRPVDRAALLSFAAYIEVNQTTFPLFPMAQEYATGSQQTALSSYDAAFRNRIDLQTDDTSSLAQVYDDMAADYDGARPSGMSNLTYEMYEGGHSIIFPKISDYVTAGYSADSTVTFDVATEKVLDATHAHVNGNRVSFSGGVLPTGLTASTEYLIINSNPGVDYQVAQIATAPLSLSTAIALSGTPSGTTTATATTYSCDNLITAWLNDDRADAWVRYFATKFSDQTKFPHIKRVGFLNLAGWQSLTNTPPRWYLWSLYPTNIASTPFKLYDGIRDFNATAR